MRVLVLTNMYPVPDMPAFGTFVRDQVVALRKEGVDIDVFFVNGRKNKLNYLWGIFRLWVWLLSHRYDLIHAHYVFSGILARMQFLLPVVLTHHGHEVFMSWQHVSVRIITRLVDKVIVVSQEQRQKLGHKKIAIIPCGIDFDFFKPMSHERARRKLNLPSEKKLVLWAGESFIPEKRIDLVQQAVAQLKKRDPSVDLVLVSGQPHEVVPMYMNACDVLLLVSDGEGSPMVIKEAMACNLPIVACPVGDVTEVISGTEGCYLCSQNPSDIVEKLALVLNQPKRTKGRKMVKQMEQSCIAKRIIAVYQEVLQGKKGSSVITNGVMRNAR